MKRLPQSAIEKIGYYVYLLRDPLTHKVFYVGKGKGSRILSHENFIEKIGFKDSKKNKKIREIQSRATHNKVEYQILRHGLNEKEAFEVEASVIDLIGIENLTNEIKSLDSSNRGITDLNEILIKYTTEEAIIDIPVILINLNNTYRPGMTANEVFNITKGRWKLNPTNASKYRYVFAVYRGIVRELFEVSEWLPSDMEGRYEFRGIILEDDKMRNKYLNKSVKNFINIGNQNPIKYVN
ncbi:MAG: LEM-3-like GIY-YIG domain-containing protein [Candidatus Dojkabacteria bacterium]